MLDHMTFRVSDMTRTKAFYAAALDPLGYKLVHEGNHDGANLAGFGFADASLPQGMRIDTWFIDGPSPYGGHPITAGCHLCWRAVSRAQVDAFYRAAMAQGGKDNGAPGVRAHYHPDYYGAFVIDPDGNNVEAVCHTPVT